MKSTKTIILSVLNLWHMNIGMYFKYDELAKIWREELGTAKNSNNININNATEFTEYSLQMIEIDAEAFTVYYLKEYENIYIDFKSSRYKRLIDNYINVHKKLF